MARRSGLSVSRSGVPSRCNPTAPRPSRHPLFIEKVPLPTRRPGGGSPLRPPGTPPSGCGPPRFLGARRASVLVRVDEVFEQHVRVASCVGYPDTRTPRRGRRTGSGSPSAGPPTRRPVSLRPPDQRGSLWLFRHVRVLGPGDECLEPAWLPGLQLLGHPVRPCPGSAT